MFQRLASSKTLVQSVTSKRLLHQVPVLPRHTEFSRAGVDGLYSESGYASAWTQYQNFLTTSLTMKTAGGQHEGLSPYQILLSTAKRTTEQNIFFYASQAHNNHFFFQQLAPKEQAQKTKPSRFLMERLTGITSLEQLREKVMEMARGVEGQGWIFLVESPDKSIRLVTCHNDGTPYYYGKNQSVDLNGVIGDDKYMVLKQVQEQAREDSLDFTLPLLAFNLWDVAYYHDYGLTGRDEYLRNVFECINWDVVNKRLFQV